jgi:hypothetical protein
MHGRHFAISDGTHQGRMEAFFKLRHQPPDNSTLHAFFLLNGLRRCVIITLPNT